jgi:D-alanine-D-alanine ligase-like ATP-grasp enzyme
MHDTKEVSEKKDIPCPDCGNAPVNHTIEKTSIFIYWFLSPLNKPFDWLWKICEPIFGPFIWKKGLPAFYKLLVFLHLGTIAEEPDEKTGGRARAFWEEAKRRGIYMWEFRLFGKGRELFVAEWTPSIDANGTLIPPEERKLEKHAFDGLPRPGDRSSDALMWMDNKGLMREKFSAAGIPIAQGGVAFLWWKTKKLFQKLTPPVIIKPNLGSRSRHTTTHIVNLEQLQAAYKNATVLSPWVIIEEEHIGLVHRATVIGGKLIGVLRREPPCVWGDGIHTIAELIAIENENPLRKGPIFHEINIESPELHKELRRQTLTLDHVAGPNILVTLGEKASRGLGGGATDVTDETHPDNRELFEYVAQVLEDPLVGIDFIIDDISKSWKEQRRCGVIECNSLPFIELHLFPLKGLPRDTAGALWDTIFPDSNPHLQK